MSETRVKHASDGDQATAGSPRSKGQDPLEASLDELARSVDALVDGLKDDAPQEPEPHAEETEESRRAEMRQTLDALDHLIEDPSPPSISAEIELDGDRGEDISQRLDVLLTETPLDEATASGLTLDGALPPAVGGNGEPHAGEQPETVFPEEPCAGPDLEEAIELSATTAELRVESHSVEVSEQAVEAEIGIETEVVVESDLPVEAEVAAETEAAIATVGTATISNVETTADRVAPQPSRRRSKSIWWVLAVMALIGTVAGTIWFIRAPVESALTGGESDVAMPDPPVVFTKTSVEVPAKPVPVAEPRSTPNPGATDSLARTTTQEDRTVPAPVKPEPVAEPRNTPDSGATDSLARSEPEPVRSVTESTAVESIGEPASEAMAQPRSTIGTAALSPPSNAARTVTVTTTPGDSAQESQAQVRTASAAGGSLIFTLAEPSSPESTDSLGKSEGMTPAAPEPVEPIPPAAVEPVTVLPDRPPTVIERVEATIHKSSLKRGEKQTVVLQVLVTEAGRVSRVIVDEGVHGSETEAAAINAVLRWTYEPARENGEPISRWTTERFEFERPAN